MGKRRERNGEEARHAGEQGESAAAVPVTRELARVRARFGIDPAVARRSLAEAWTSPTDTMEEDEAEFLDAVADCLSVGLSMEAALTSWDSGSLASGEDDDESDESDEPEVVFPIVPHASPPGRRLLVR